MVRVAHFHIDVSNVDGSSTRHVCQPKDTLQDVLLWLKSLDHEGAQWTVACVVEVDVTSVVEQLQRDLAS